jgi:hypothetical protein
VNQYDRVREKPCPYCGEAVPTNRFYEHLPCDQTPDVEAGVPDDLEVGRRA